MYLQIIFLAQLDAKDFVAFAVAAISLVTLIKGIIEYTKAQSWKKAEFISKEVKEFYSDINVQRALKFLDWDSGKIDLKENEIAGKNLMYFNNKDLIKSLRNHNDGDTNFTYEEEKIREIIDALLDKLSLFQHFIDGKVFAPKDLKGYLKYWTNIMFDAQNVRPSKTDFSNALKKYMDAYHFDDLKRLVKSFGYNV
jgi:hypothetical protein